MEKSNKYTFTKTNEQTLEALKNFFDKLLEVVMPETAKLQKELFETDSDEAPDEEKAERFVREFDEFKKFVASDKDLKRCYINMLDLMELEKRYNRQRFVNLMLDGENYEILAQMRDSGQLK